MAPVLYMPSGVVLQFYHTSFQALVASPPALRVSALRVPVPTCPVPCRGLCLLQGLYPFVCLRDPRVIDATSYDTVVFSGFVFAFAVSVPFRICGFCGFVVAFGVYGFL